MNFNHAFRGANPSISISADDFIGMRRLQAQLREQVEQLSNSCGALENQLRAEIQARRATESQLFQVEQRRQAREDEVVALRSQLHQERLRADAMCRAGRPVLDPGLVPVRIVPVGDCRTDRAEAREFGRNDSVEPSKPSEPSPGPVPPLSQYPCEIPEKDREVIRARMLKDRGPNTPAPAASPQDVEKAPPAPSPGAHVSGPSHDDDITQHKAGTSQLGQEGQSGAADVDREETEDDCSANEAGTSQLGQEGLSGAADVDSEETEDDCSANEAGTSQLGQGGETGAGDIDPEETDDDCAANMEMDDDDSDDEYGCARDATTSASSFTLGCPGNQEPCDEDGGNEPAGLASSTVASTPAAAEHVVTNPTAADDDRSAHDTTTSASSFTLNQEPCDEDGDNKPAGLASSPTAASSPAAAEHVATNPTAADDRCADDPTTSASSITFGCPGKQELCDEDDGNEPARLASCSTAAERMVTNPMPADDDSCAHDTTASASSIAFGCPGKQEPCDEDDGNEPARLASCSTAAERVVTNPTAADNVVTNGGLAPVKTEGGVVPCTVGQPASFSSADGQETGKPAGIPSPSGGVNAPSVVKTEAISSRKAPVATTGSTPPAPISYSHQLFSSTLTEVNCSTRSVSDRTDAALRPPDSVDDRQACDADTRGDGDSIDVKRAPRMDRFSHNTFCSSCKSFRTDEDALAKCTACPRVLCRACAGQKGEKVPRGVNADDTVLCPDKCVCQKRDSAFTKPPRGRDPQAHLLKKLKEHDLAYMFLEPVNVEENVGYLCYVSRDDMIDLGTMTTKMKKRKQYQSSRGKLMFRRDLKRVWENCWKFARHTPECSKEKAAGIVRCTIILEAMVGKFYAAYMEEKKLVTDEESWQADRERRNDQKFVMCANLPPSEPPVAATEFEGGSDDDVDLDEENRRIGATVGRKRKFVFREDDDEEEYDDDVRNITKASAGKEGLDPNICALAAIGQDLKSGKT